MVNVSLAEPVSVAEYVPSELNVTEPLTDSDMTFKLAPEQFGIGL
jgi:hypothetical protein